MIAFVNWTPMIKWLHMARLAVKNGHQAYSSYNEIGLRAQNIVVTLASIVHTIGMAYVITERERRVFNNLT